MLVNVELEGTKKVKISFVGTGEARPSARATTGTGVNVEHMTISRGQAQEIVEKLSELLNERE
jgi:hypothetical protein